MRGPSQKEGGSVAALFVRSNRLPQCQMMCGLHRRRLGADFSLPSIGRYFISNQTFGHLIKAVSGSGAVPCPNSEFRHNLSNCCYRTRALDVQHSSSYSNRICCRHTFGAYRAHREEDRHGTRTRLFCICIRALYIQQTETQPEGCLLCPLTHTKNKNKSSAGAMDGNMHPTAAQQQQFSFLSFCLSKSLIPVWRRPKEK